MSFIHNKMEHHKFEAIMHEGFYETLDRCAGQEEVNFDSPQFV